jgi:broad specificity phosphatase PhoE
MKIYLVRHAQSRWQLEPSPDLDTELTPVGHEQAKRLGQWLAEQKKSADRFQIEISGLWASPYRRAQETANYVSNALRLEVHICPDLREANFHVADDLPSMETPWGTHAPYEPTARYAAFKAQVRIGFEHLMTQVEAVGGPVLAVTHGAFIKTLFRLMTGTDAICFQLHNAGLNAIEWKRGRWHLIHLSICDFLPAELRTF